MFCRFVQLHIDRISNWVNYVVLYRVVLKNAENKTWHSYLTQMYNKLHAKDNCLT
jgi:hypothetical protein